MPTHMAEKIYQSSPVWMQNLLVSLYGLAEHQRRYKGDFSSWYQTLKEQAHNSAEEVDAREQQQLSRILEHALRTVPFYQNLRLTSADLTKFPILERETIAESPEQFVSNTCDRSKLLTLYTGGSTGTPLKVYISKSIRQKNYAHWALFYEQMGFTIGEKKATFVGRLVQNPNNQNPPFWRYNFIDKQLVFSSYHLTDENIPAYLEKLNAFSPRLLEGYPNTLFRLAEYITTHSAPIGFQPCGISVSSESFTPEQRKVMENAFNTRVYDQYGSAESVVFASECSHGTMHVAPEFGIVEVLDSEGNISREGSGEFLVTTLLNDVMPLIRYKIGDLGTVTRTSCPCGRHTYVITELSGKAGAVIVSEGRKVPTAALAIAFEYVEPIRRSQIIQNQPDKILVKLAVRDTYNQKDEDFVLWELRKMLGTSIGIDFEYVDDIPPGKNGKYQMVVQNFY